jgi:hypothetical protein
MRKIPAAKAGNMAILFQAEFKTHRSRAFAPPDTGKMAVKAINHYGGEVLKVYPID